jgi:hypothetical protein
MLGLFRRRRPVTKGAPGRIGPGGDHHPSETLGTGQAREPYREALAALNVKVICDLACLPEERANHDMVREEAVALALSIGHGFCKDFAFDEILGFCRRTGELGPAQDLLDTVDEEVLKNRVLETCLYLGHLRANLLAQIPIRVILSRIP